MSKDRRHIPKASTLMGSLRSMGYSFEAAVADVIDNSISAHAKNIYLLFPQNPLEDLALGILDDGEGMTNEMLMEAMRYGSCASEDERAVDDLGRFGMGLKSASLSQCRILTVVSYDDNQLNAYRWDYNYILEKGDWILQELNTTEIDSLPYINLLKEQKKGTLVIWQDFDIIAKSSNGQVYNSLVDLRSSLDGALSLIFHRYISSGLKMYVGKYKLKALDPFLENHPKTTHKKERTLEIQDSHGKERLIRIKPFILPFATDLREEDKRLLGGIENMRAKQGFYIYRNKRLIIWGTWFGMKQRGELTKNARIRVDIPNSLDDIWSIDIKKQRAEIPKTILHSMKKMVEEALEISVTKQSYRGRTHNVDDSIDYIWSRKEGRSDTFFYQINRESKLYHFVKEKVSDEDFVYLDMLLTEIEKNIPIQQMYIDKSNEAISQPEENDSRMSDLLEMGITMAAMIRSVRNDTVTSIVDDLMKSEPFCNYPTLKDLLLSNIAE